MKKILFLLLAVSLFTACSDDDDNKGQDYTSFVFYQTADVTLPNCVAGYKTPEGTYVKISDLGELSKGEYSPEVRVNDNNITEIYFFTDYNGCVKFDAVYTLRKNTKNILKLLETTGGISVTDKTDPFQYPQ